jgi:hypothetical protein
MIKSNIPIKEAARNIDTQRATLKCHITVIEWVDEKCNDTVRGVSGGICWPSFPQQMRFFNPLLKEDVCTMDYIT